jgi:hypothetical protein
MSLLIGCKNKNGIVLAADSRALDVAPDGHVQEMSVRRLVQLNASSAIVAGGAAAGVHMAQALKGFIADEKIADVEQVYQAALPFLASEYERFMRKTCEVAPLDPVHRVQFMLGGKSESDSQNPFRLYFLWTKRNLPRLDGDEIGAAFSVPRLFRLEYRLSQLCANDAGLNQILEELGIAMRQQADIQEEIAGPFASAVIDHEGIRVLEHP